jgi:hypothetical protein
MNVNRRTLVRSTAWTVPAVSVAAAAPAFATSGATEKLEWTFAASPVPLAGASATSCADLAITFDNTASNIDLLPTEVLTEAQVFGVWQKQPQVNDKVIAAGTTYTMNANAAIPAGIPIRFTVTYADANGATVRSTTNQISTGSCGAKATFRHVSTQA